MLIWFRPSGHLRRGVIEAGPPRFPFIILKAKRGGGPACHRMLFFTSIYGPASVPPRYRLSQNAMFYEHLRSRLGTASVPPLTECYFLRASTVPPRYRLSQNAMFYEHLRSRLGTASHRMLFLRANTVPPRYHFGTAFHRMRFFTSTYSLASVNWPGTNVEYYSFLMEGKGALAPAVAAAFSFATSARYRDFKDFDSETLAFG